MSKAKNRHMFLGGNTCKGFYSFFDQILSQEEANRIICLKGGPGTGKSSLMKKLAFHFATNGYTVEEYHCSSDNQSLDGVLVKELKVAILDGTAPHVVDPIHPGAVDKIVHLADALDFDKVQPYKKEIIDISNKISNNFKRAYTYFDSASKIYLDWRNLNKSALNKDFLSAFEETLKIAVLPKTESKEKNTLKSKHLFATAFTPNGIVSFGEDLATFVENLFVLKGEPGFSKSYLLKSLGKSAEGLGYFVEYFHHPLLPEEIEGINIPEAKVGVFTENEISKLNLKGTVFDMTSLGDKGTLTLLKDEIDFNKCEFDILLNKGLSLITEAKLLHDKLEKYYIQNMDFNAINKFYDEILLEFEKFK